MFDWNIYLDFATFQASQSTEVAQRCAMSRAYYAVYNLARLQVIKQGLAQAPEKPHHKWVWQAYKAYGGINANQISKKGLELKVFRERADYEDSIDDIDDVLEDVMKRANELRLLIKGFA